jgi:hypothetical protein
MIIGTIVCMKEREDLRGNQELHENLIHSRDRGHLGLGQEEASYNQSQLLSIKSKD